MQEFKESSTKKVYENHDEFNKEKSLKLGICESSKKWNSGSKP